MKRTVPLTPLDRAALGLADHRNEREAWATLSQGPARGHHLPDDSLSRLARWSVSQPGLDAWLSFVLIVFCAALALVLAGCARVEPSAEPVKLPSCETYAGSAKCKRLLTAIDDGGMRT